MAPGISVRSCSMAVTVSRSISLACSSGSASGAMYRYAPRFPFCFTVYRAWSASRNSSVYSRPSRGTETAPADTPTDALSPRMARAPTRYPSLMRFV